MIASFWNYIFILCFAVILSLQIIFLCGYERKRYGNKKKAKTQEVISFSIDNDKALKAELISQSVTSKNTVIPKVKVLM
uniref:ATP synthase F0 subunit 8 n=1 Tax=Panagrolaimus superbus TaxID=310955 RepID=A0A914XUI5_9BILA